MEVGDQRHIPAPLPLGMNLYPFYRRLFRSQVRRFDPQTIQLVASRYTDCTIPVHNLGVSILNNVSINPLERLGTAYKLQLLCL
jgi:hypothetical protein